MYRLIRITSLLAVLGVAAACSRRPAPEPTVTPTTNGAAEAAEAARRDSIARAEAARRDSIARAAAEADRLRGERERALSEARAMLGAAIYFDYDSDALSEAARQSLEGKLAILNANPSLRIRIAGHADERGSDTYNLTLGQRRAAAAKRYLVQRGVAEGRIEVVSYGEERPVATGSDESAWAQNRRDEFEIIAGGDQMRAPTRS